jgi:thiol-disulfide isomerase/thioredoxin
VLADNSLAKAFQPPDEAELPSVIIWGPGGKRGLDTLRGRTVLMPLWAEWCAPCMSELPDFARLQEKYGNDKFAIIPILSGTHKKFTPEALGDLFKLAHCGVFEPLIENNLGDRLARVMARRHDTYVLPCNLLIAPDGRVVGRETGALSNSDDAAPAKTYKETLNRVGAGDVQSRWGQADGEEFAKAMAAGFPV